MSDLAHTSVVRQAAAENGRQHGAIGLDLLDQPVECGGELLLDVRLVGHERCAAQHSYGPRPGASGEAPPETASQPTRRMLISLPSAARDGCEEGPPQPALVVMPAHASPLIADSSPCAEADAGGRSKKTRGAKISG